MAVKILDLDASIELSLTYWTDSLSENHAGDVVDAILQALDAIVEDPGRQLPVVDLLTEDGRERIQSWNNNYPSAIESTVPELFSQKVSEHLVE
jgi:hypothetical protein